MAIGALIVAGISLFGASKSRKRRRRAQRAQDEASRNQTNLHRENMEFTREQWREWSDQFKPLFADMRNQLADADRVDYSGVVGDATAAYDSAVGQARRQAERFGLNPADGAWADMEQRAGIGRAASIVDGMNRQRMGARDRKWGMTAQLAGMAGNMASSAAGMHQNAVSGLSNAYGNQMNMHGQRAAEAGAAEQAGYAAAGQAIGGMNWGGAGKTQQAGVTSINWNVPGQGVAKSSQGGGFQPGPWQGGYQFPTQQQYPNFGWAQTRNYNSWMRPGGG
jgi:hypothetical protein